MVGLFGEKSGKKNESFLPFSLAKKEDGKLVGHESFLSNPTKSDLGRKWDRKEHVATFFLFSSSFLFFIFYF